MRGQRIIVSADPKGIFLDGIISGTPKPGTIMQIDVSEGIDEATGRPTYEVFNRDFDGQQGQMAVLLEDDLQGKTASDAYVSGTLGQLYIPLPGEELNMLVKDVSGTADDHSLGATMMVDDGTGMLVTAYGSAESESFQLLEALTDITADTLAHCVFLGK